MSRPARLTSAAVSPLLLAAGLALGACHHARPAVAPSPGSSALLATTANVGFDEPENLVYDSVADVYLVSNIRGGPAAKDGDGFISRVGPDGRVLALRWIAGGTNGAQLDAPKGLAIRGDTLAVADVGAVHLFDRRTGAPLASITVPGLVLNDLAWGTDGSLWITDTGPDRGTTPIDTTKDMDALWRVPPGGTPRAVARGLALDRPDGLVLDGRDALVATFGADRIERVNETGVEGTSTFARLPGGRVDGLRRLPDGGLLVTSWDAQAVWRLESSGGGRRVLLAGVTSPAGVAVDTRRHRLAVTSMQGNALYLLPLR